MLTLADLGVLRDVRVRATAPSSSRSPRPTPAARRWASMRADLVRALHARRVRRRRRPHRARARLVHRLDQRRGRRKLAEAGIAPPGPAPRRRAGPVPLRPRPRPARRRTARGAARRTPRCLSEFGATACTALYRCRACREPFEHVKEI